MKRALYLSTVLAILCITATTRADQARKRAKDINPDSIVQAAKTMSQALIGEDYGKLVDFTYPKVVEMAGGREKMIELAKTGMANMKKAGYILKGNKIDAPTGIADAGDRIMAIVPETTEIDVPAGKVTRRSYLIAISSDEGSKWTFIDGAGINKAQDLKALLPDFPSELKLPPPQKSEFEAKK